MVSKLWQRDGYTNPNIRYILSTDIREYDISKANISILRELNCIDDKTYNHLYNHKLRKVLVGLLLRDNPDYNKALSEGFKEFRRRFFEANNLEDNDILSIKKDAIFIINKPIHINEFGRVKFLNKNVYTSYYKVETHNMTGQKTGNYEYYFYYNQMYKTELLDIKGIGSDALVLHEPFFLDFLKYLFTISVTEDIRDVMSTITNFIDRYIKLDLDSGYYREFNSYSHFRIQSGQFHTFFAQWLESEEMKNYLDIRENLQILQILASYYSDVLFKTIK